MPIVFVHGVAHRESADTPAGDAGRNAFLREIVAPALGLPPGELSLSSPYWGGHAAAFAWNMAVLPEAAASHESFGAGDEALARTIDLVAESQMQGSVVGNAKRDFAGTVDVLYAAALAGATDEGEARELAASYLAASAYAAANPHPAWLDSASDENFADLLSAKVKASAAGAGESFGGGLLDSLKEGLSRFAGALPDAATALAGKLARKKLNATVTRFAGDAFVYLAKRGTPEHPGKIVEVVRDALRAAAAQKTGADDKLVVIAHSFGGEIVYDILTHFDTDLEVDCLVTVGSQVGLFEELKLYLASDAAVGAESAPAKVARPLKLKRWLNVYDSNDVLSYRVAPVFADADDFHYDTGYSTLQAHGGYFQRPSFYKRLAARLAT